MTKVVPKMAEIHCLHCSYPHEDFQCCVCARTFYNIKVSPRAHNYVIDLLPLTVSRPIKPGWQAQSKKKQLIHQHAKSRKFYVTKVEMIGTSGCIPVKFCIVHKCRTDVHALGKLVSMLDPEVRFYGDSAYH